MSRPPVYLDYNATTPIDPAVAAAMLPYLHEHFGNPSSSHYYGQKARRAVEHARTQVAGLLGCRPQEVIFTGGGTESNNQALFGIAAALRDHGKHVITSRIEHPAIVEPCLALMEQGLDVTFLPVDTYGQVRTADLAAAIRRDTILVSIMHANNEVGSLQPIAEISRITRQHQVLLHTDAAQSVGKIPTDVEELGVDLLTIAGHKLYASKGVGALYVRNGVPLVRLLHGAGQERGLRPGTENVLEIVGLGEAAALAQTRGTQETVHLQKLRDHLQNCLQDAIPDVVVHGHPDERLPNTLSIAFPGCRTDQLLRELQSVAASAGAACHADTVKISHVLEAMQVPIALARGTLRFSVGRFTTETEVDQAVGEIVQVVERIRAMRSVE
jgi:cysteine desulfurase